MTRLLPRGRFFLPKEYLAHGTVLLIVGAVVLANYLTTSADRGSLLFALFREAEVEEGPLAPRAQGDRPRAAFLSLIPSAAAGGVSEDDIEFELANTLGGNALVATASPETTEASAASRSGVLAYTVQDGDTPASIAARFGVSTNTVLWANGIRDGDVIRAGDVLVILPVSGVLHTVVAGDDVTTLAAKYDAKVEDIIARNVLGESGTIQIGRKIVIPDGQLLSPPRRVVAYQREQEEEPKAPSDEQGPSSPPRPGTGLLWPTTTRGISQYFGWRHMGVDIPNKSQPALAAQEGQVAFSGWLGGYGRLVILDHGRGLQTYYAHLSQAYVKAGDRLARGEAVGKIGCTGRCTGPHLHFEVRQGGRAVNPLRNF